MEKDKKKIAINSVVQMANPSFYIKENKFFDEWSLFERCRTVLDQEFFNENKNLLILAGVISEEEISKVLELYQALIYPKAVLYIGAEDELSNILKQKFTRLSYLSFDFDFKEFQDSYKALVGVKNA